MRLIDADALKKEVKTLFCPDGYKIMMLERIDSAPAVIKCSMTSDGLPLMDLRPRPQGKWIYHKGNGLFLPTMECSQCHERVLLGDLTPKLYKDYYKICFRCGADMRGEEK